MRLSTILLGVLILSAPAHAGDDIAAARGIITSQVDALGRDDATAAYGFAAPAIQQIFPEADTFLNMVRKNYAPIYRHKSLDFGDAKTMGTTIMQEVHIVDGDGVPWEALYTLQPQPDGSLKITGCVLLKAPGQAV